RMTTGKQPIANLIGDTKTIEQRQSIKNLEIVLGQHVICGYAINKSFHIIKYCIPSWKWNLLNYYCFPYTIFKPLYVTAATLSIQLLKFLFYHWNLTHDWMRDRAIAYSEELRKTLHWEASTVIKRYSFPKEKTQRDVNIFVT
ncbi:hypothetical protein ACJX0J_017366, partial [Zea mays]